MCKDGSSLLEITKLNTIKPMTFNYFIKPNILTSPHHLTHDCIRIWIFQ